MVTWYWSSDTLLWQLSIYHNINVQYQWCTHGNGATLLLIGTLRTDGQSHDRKPASVRTVCIVSSCWVVMSAFLSFSSTEIYMALVLLPEMMTTYLAPPFLRILSITRSLVELSSIVWVTPCILYVFRNIQPETLAKKLTWFIFKMISADYSSNNNDNHFRLSNSNFGQEKVRFFYL